MADQSEPTVVTVPASMASLFSEAESLFRGYFGALELRPENADIIVGGVRYVLLRSDSFSLELHEELRSEFGDELASKIRYRLAKSLGSRDAKHYLQRLDVADPMMRVALGPVHFAFVGWASVEMLPESQVQSDEDCLLLYRHGSSFEADAYLNSGRAVEETVCCMNAGYSAGWVQAAVGVEMDATEVTCRARGDQHCSFVMAHPGKLLESVQTWRSRLSGEGTADP